LPLLLVLQDANWEFMRANNKIRFIRAVITGELKVSNRKRADIEADLEAQGYDKMAKSKDVSPETPVGAGERQRQGPAGGGRWDRPAGTGLWQATASCRMGSGGWGV
jgi:hypothetical protein